MRHECEHACMRGSAIMWHQHQMHTNVVSAGNKFLLVLYVYHDHARNPVVARLLLLLHTFYRLVLTPFCYVKYVCVFMHRDIDYGWAAWSPQASNAISCAASGHVNFSDDMTAAKRLSDGMLLVVVA